MSLLPWTVMFGLCISTFTWIRLESSKATTRLPLKARDQSSWVEKSHQKYFKLDPFISWHQIQHLLEITSLFQLSTGISLVTLNTKRALKKWKEREQERNYHINLILTWMKSESHWMYSLLGGANTAGHFIINFWVLPPKRLTLFSRFSTIT